VLTSTDPRSALTLRGTRVELRPYDPADAPVVAAAVEESRASLARWVPDIARPRDAADVRAALRALAADARTGSRLVFGSWRDDQFLGETGLYDIDWQARVAEIGYWLRESARGQGYATEAAQTLLEYAASLGLRTFEAHIALDNHASRRIVERLGFAISRYRMPSPRWDGNANTVAVYVRTLT
jgi:RimJ/RimL family protein N-acetyltransferase